MAIAWMLAVVRRVVKTKAMVRRITSIYGGGLFDLVLDDGDEV